MGHAPVQILETQPPTPAPDNQGLRWAELALVCAVSFLQPIFQSIMMLKFGIPANVRYGAWNVAWFYGLLNEALGLCFLMYVLKRSGRSFSDLGFSFRVKDAGVGALLYVGSMLAYYVGASLIYGAYHFWYGAAPPRVDTTQLFGGGLTALIVPYILLTPFFEELIVRAYVTTELSALTGSVALATVVSVLLQTSYHLYYGIVGALSVGCSFVVLAIYYAKTRRVWPIIIAHGLLDIIATLGMFARAR